MTRHLQTVAEIMTAPPITVGPNTTLFDAYRQMHENDIRRLPVTAADGSLIGIITLSDIQKTIPMLREDSDSETELLLNGQFVHQVMSADPVTVSSEETIQDVAEAMLENQVSGVPVVQGGKLVGIITESDIFELIVASWGELVFS